MSIIMYPKQENPTTYFSNFFFKIKEITPKISFIVSIFKSK